MKCFSITSALEFHLFDKIHRFWSWNRWQLSQLFWFIYQASFPINVTPEACILLHSPTQVAVILSVSMRHGLQLARITLLWLVGQNRGCDYLVSWCTVGSCDWWEFPSFYNAYWPSSCTALMAGKCLLLGQCKETVKESKNHASITSSLKPSLSYSRTSSVSFWSPSSPVSCWLLCPVCP